MAQTTRDATEATAGENNWPIFRSLASFRLSDLPGDLIGRPDAGGNCDPRTDGHGAVGFSPQIGFFAFIAGSIGFAILGGNRFRPPLADFTITPIFAAGLALLAHQARRTIRSRRRWR